MTQGRNPRSRIPALSRTRAAPLTYRRHIRPHSSARIGDQRLASAHEIAEAAQEGAFIGGDLYAVQDTPYGVRLVVGDVRGKGMGAVAEQGATLEAGAALVREGVRRGGVEADEGFATAVLAELPHGGGDGDGSGSGDGAVRIVDRGHPPPLLLHGDGRVSAVRAPEAALPLGWASWGRGPTGPPSTRSPAERPCCCTPTASPRRGTRTARFYDPERRPAGRTFAAPGALLARLAAEVRRHAGGGVTDDMALLAVRRP
ncbi:SpoIIE family protein phosphatase [Streptomyces sp. NPDC004237]|uniref:SpoIIE family protein phosphatase n=1 Tax=Streptomyces sp. NPDC004237 TaxID=3154455 RepID=UPI0033A4155C